MNKHEEVWETIYNEVAYLHNGSLDARKGSLAKQVADTLTPFVEDMLREAQAKACDEGRGSFAGLSGTAYIAERLTQGDSEGEDDANLIANAPSWLAALCDLLDAAEAKLAAVLMLVDGTGRSGEVDTGSFDRIG